MLLRDLFCCDGDCSRLVIINTGIPFAGSGRPRSRDQTTVVKSQNIKVSESLDSRCPDAAKPL
jgi:hypothetical protein